ncbi:palmitoyltransferase ZDHHC3 [Ischnura elegans]|uniref:palmitoyltransferase ZDHHC3 n=1 Tax=Ischnura elegans TaxID=197161 RepID=UPI001ED898F4|nr:palmitoyltransferase ZDHHC3 [Ischnura elegans]XP_046388190.1 palmitoyltransferase ZDHHC3 [Ischnura elegans]
MPVCIKDPCGFLCILLTYIAVFYADYVVIQWVVLQTMRNSLWGPFNAVLFNTIIFLLGMAHLKAVCSDPGIVPLPQSRLDFSDIHTGSQKSLQLEDWTVCTRCETYRPPRAHHCRICKRCIRRMDHHCPWINNCVGELNQKYFIQFLVYVGMLSGYAILLVITSWVGDCPHCSEEVLVKQSRILHSVILVLESTLFGMFVGAILADQIQAILTDETGVEQVQSMRLKGRPQRRSKHPRYTLMAEVCGRGHPLLWLLPCMSSPSASRNSPSSPGGTLHQYEV